MKASVFVGAAALCFFPCLEEAPCSLSSKLKAKTARDGEKRLTHIVRWSRIARLLCLFPGYILCVCAFVCKDGYLITLICVLDWVYNDTTGASCFIFLSPSLCMFEWKKCRKQLYLYVCASYLKAAVSILACLDAGINKLELICGIRTCQFYQKGTQSVCWFPRHPVTHPYPCTF